MPVLSSTRVRVFGAISAAVLLGGLVLAAPTSGLKPPPVDGVGSVSCSVMGALKFDPPLRVTSSPVPTTVTLRVVLKQCTGTGAGANLLGGVVNVSGQAASNDCLTVLQNAASHARSGSITWRATRGQPKLNPSAITFTSASRDGGPPITVDSAGSATSGSFSGDASATHIIVRQTFDKMKKSCLGARGLKAINTVPGSTFSLTAP